MPIYQFQCMRCFIVSGYMSANLHDAPTCCDGELMVAIKILPFENVEKEGRDEIQKKARCD